MDRNTQFEIYRVALARLERRNQLIIKALRSAAYQQALEYATTPPDMIFSALDFAQVKDSKRIRVEQLDLFGGEK